MFYLMFLLLLPAVEGGALLLSGVLVDFTGCSFDSNMAGEDGLAVMNLGVVNNISDLAFLKNSVFCSSGKYGLEEDAVLVEV